MMPTTLAVAPNGARLTKADHPALPMTADEIGRAARVAADAGATVIHFHARDEAGLHSLDVELCRAALAAVKRDAGERIVAQLSTEAVGRYAPSEQIACVLAVRPEQASIAIRELTPAGDDVIARFCDDCRRQGTSLQFILYNADDARALRTLAVAGKLAIDQPSVLAVLGRERQPPQAESTDLDRACPWIDPAWIWMVCAFGPLEHSIGLRVAGMGGHMRLGFENNRIRHDGTPATDNQELLADFALALRSAGGTLASADDWRSLHQLRGGL